MEELCVRSKESSNLVEAFLGRAPQHWNSSCSPAQRCFPWKVQIRMLLLSICNEWYMCVLPERADFTLLFSPWLAFPWVSFLCILVGVRMGVLARSSTARRGWQQPVPVSCAGQPHLSQSWRRKLRAMPWVAISWLNCGCGACVDGPISAPEGFASALLSAER